MQLVSFLKREEKKWWIQIPKTPLRPAINLLMTSGDITSTWFPAFDADYFHNKSCLFHHWLRQPFHCGSSSLEFGQHEPELWFNAAEDGHRHLVTADVIRVGRRRRFDDGRCGRGGRSGRVFFATAGWTTEKRRWRNNYRMYVLPLLAH